MSALKLSQIKNHLVVKASPNSKFSISQMIIIEQTTLHKVRLSQVQLATTQAVQLALI